MNKMYTSIKQSKTLLDLRIDSGTADMWWLYITSQGKHIAMMYEEPDPHYLARMESYGIKDAAIPCWSLGTLLELIPSFLVLENKSCILYIKKYPQRYEIYYANKGFAPEGIIEGSTLIDAAFNMVVWLLENDYIKQK